MALGNFEQLCKMTRLGPEPLSTLSAPPPVKFRPVYFNPVADDEENSHSRMSDSDEFEMDEEILHADLSFDGKHFYKDPLCPSYSKTDDSSAAEEESSSSNKLGRNMRACGSTRVKQPNTSVWGQMVARNQLLDEQKQQHLKHSNRETTDKEAAALVNKLLQQGFHITAPETTPRFTNDDDQTKAVDLSNGVDVNSPDSSIVRHEGDLVKSIHSELKRVRGVCSPTDSI